MNSARPIEPPTVLFASEEFSRTIPASLDAGWSFAEEAAATDGALMGNPDAQLGDFPPGATYGSSDNLSELAPAANVPRGGTG